MTACRALFVDRDGVLNADREDRVLRPHQVVVLPGAARALAAVRRAGVPVIVVTNQAAIGHGMLSVEGLAEVNGAIAAALGAEAEGSGWDALYYCPHAPRERCDCRKPKPGMIRTAASELGIDTVRSAFVGDRQGDMTAARRAGVHRRVLVGDCALAPTGDETDRCADLAAAVDMLLPFLAPTLAERLA